VWDNEINVANQLGDFKTDIAKETASLGSWTEDYEQLCKKHGIIPFSFAKFHTDETSNKSSCIVMNCEVDLGNWRAVLLAANCSGTLIHEYRFINLKLTHQHILDFAAALEKSSSCEIVKMEYVVVEGEAEAVEAAWKVFFAAVGSGVAYLSLKGNNIDDEFIINCKTELQGALSLKHLNFAENRISDAGLSAITQLLLLHPYLQHVSLKNNLLTGSTLSESLRGLVFGKVVAPEEEAGMKSMVKSVADRNKQIKDTNKKRKKQGLPELEEIPSPASRVVKVESGETLIVNRSSLILDISRNTAASAGLATYLQGLIADAASVSANVSQLSPLTIKCTGLMDDAMRVIPFGDVQQLIVVVE